MLKRLRAVLACLAVAVLACGNALNSVAEATEHPVGLHMMGASQVLIHSHGHNHDTAHLGDLSQSSGTCQGAGCDTGEHPGQPCCHVHAHCCVSGGFLPSDLSVSGPAMRQIEQSLIANALPDGAIVNPLLRPPRAAG